MIQVPLELLQFVKQAGVHPPLSPHVFGFIYLLDHK